MNDASKTKIHCGFEFLSSTFAKQQYLGLAYTRKLVLGFSSVVALVTVCIQLWLYQQQLCRHHAGLLLFFLLKYLTF